ncbi:unnamed protein product [Heterobilharzia americana]|nr:unnamed protein product [Heterobilharzia americana]
MQWSVWSRFRDHRLKPVCFSFRSVYNIKNEIRTFSIRSRWILPRSRYAPTICNLRSTPERMRSKPTEGFGDPNHIDALLESGNLIQGKLYETTSYSYVFNPYDGRRIHIHNADQHGFHGDIVLVELLPINEWRITDFWNSEVLDQISSGKEVISSEISQLDESVFDPPLDVILETDTSESSALIGLTPTMLMELKKYRYHTVKEVVEILQSLPYSSILDILKSLDLSRIPSFACPLPYPNLIRTGVVRKVLKSNPNNERILGRLAFYPKFITEGFENISPPKCPPNVLSIDNKFHCILLPRSNRHLPVKLKPNTMLNDAIKDMKLGSENNFVCRIHCRNDKSSYPSGVIEENLGNLDELERETRGILVEYGIKEDEFTSEHVKGLPASADDFKIPEIEYEKRKDFRSHCVVTIDPENAKDFDDALHIRKLNNDLYEVGIHIADVSYFVYPNSPLDKKAAFRATSVYLVQRVIPMLPPILSQHLCSLVPNEDRLAFSMVLTVKENGEIVNEWFGRSIIRSRCRLTYDEAWDIIQMANSNPFSKRNAKKVLPQPEAPFTFGNLHDCLASLNKIAQNLRNSRIENGALSLEKLELSFHLPAPLSTEKNAEARGKINVDDSGNVWPQGFSVKVRNPAHYLVEEWMIAANQAVARFLFRNCIMSFKGKQGFSVDNISEKSRQRCGALLRNHAKPDERKFNQLIQIAKMYGINLDISDSASVAESIKKLAHSVVDDEKCNDKSLLGDLICSLSYMTYVRLSVALYFNLESVYNILCKRNQKIDFLGKTRPTSYYLRTLSLNRELIKKQKRKNILNYTWHYGLSIPLYTHFTSPIRRYADLVVHRQMAFILGCDDSIYPELKHLFNQNQIIFKVILIQ